MSRATHNIVKLKSRSVNSLNTSENETLAVFAAGSFCSSNSHRAEKRAASLRLACRG
jgi:hypothetical protein